MSKFEKLNNIWYAQEQLTQQSSMQKNLEKRLAVIREEYINEIHNKKEFPVELPIGAKPPKSCKQTKDASTQTVFIRKRFKKKLV